MNQQIIDGSYYICQSRELGKTDINEQDIIELKPQPEIELKIYYFLSKYAKRKLPPLIIHLRN